MTDFFGAVGRMDRGVQQVLGAATVFYTPKGAAGPIGGAGGIPGMFDQSFPFQADSGNELERPRVFVLLADLAGIDPQEDDPRIQVQVPQLGVDGVRDNQIYRVHERHPDNAGGVWLFLDKANF
jgi:hypothetical protein